MKNRKANIDLLRVLTMLGIIVFHHFGTKIPNHFVELSHGFTNESYYYDFVNNTAQSISPITLLLDFCYNHLGGGGNYVFMTITGFFLFGRDTSFSKRVYTAGRVIYAIIYYGIVLTLLNAFVLKFYPFEVYEEFRTLFTLPNWISGKNLWYLQAYGIFILAIVPLLKMFEAKLTQKTHLYIMLSLVFVHFFAYREYIPNLLISGDIVSFIMCYYIGGYFARYGIRISLKKLIVYGMIYLGLYFLYEYYWRYANSIQYDPSQYSFISVMSQNICCLIFALLSFSIFYKIRIPSNTLSRIIGRLSSASIGIYIFHYYVINLSYITAETYWWNDWSIKGLLCFAIVDSLFLFFIGFILDIVRQKSLILIETRARTLLNT